MEPHSYRFVSRWRLPAPPERVHHTLCDLPRLSAWWPDVDIERVLSSGREDGVGSAVDVAIRSAFGVSLRCTMRITGVTAPSRITVACTGDLVGTGVWWLTPERRGTRAVFEWNVVLRHRVLGRVPRWLGPILRESHGRLMRRGERGLRRFVAAPATSQTASV